jgi:hypothetical protein
LSNRSESPADVHGVEPHDVPVVCGIYAKGSWWSQQVAVWSFCAVCLGKMASVCGEATEGKDGA